MGAVLVNSCKEPVGVARGLWIACEEKGAPEGGGLKQVLLKRLTVAAENVSRHAEEQKRKTVRAHRFDRLGNETVRRVHGAIKTTQRREQLRVLLDAERLVAVKGKKVLDRHDPELLIIAVQKILLEYGTQRADSRNLADFGILKEAQDRLLNGFLSCRIHYTYH